MHSSNKKSPATEEERKTRASYKARTSINKPVNKKKTVSVDNDGSYLQAQASHSIPVSTIPPSDHSHLSASTGQAISTMLNQIDASNKELSRWMDQLECNGSISSTPLTSPTAQHRSSTMTAAQSAVPRPPTHEVAGNARTMGQGDPGTSRTASQPSVHNTFNRDAVVPGVNVLRSIPNISSTVTQLLASYDQEAVQDALSGKGHITRGSREDTT